MATKVKTKRYMLKVRIKTSRETEKAHQLICYGLSERTNKRKQLNKDKRKQ